MAGTATWQTNLFDRMCLCKMLYWNKSNNDTNLRNNPCKLRQTTPANALRLQNQHHGAHIKHASHPAMQSDHGSDWWTNWLDQLTATKKETSISSTNSDKCLWCCIHRAGQPTYSTSGWRLHPSICNCHRHMRQRLQCLPRYKHISIWNCQTQNSMPQPCHCQALLWLQPWHHETKTADIAQLTASNSHLLAFKLFLAHNQCLIQWHIFLQCPYWTNQQQRKQTCVVVLDAFHNALVAHAQELVL